MQRNIKLLKENDWVDVPIVYTSGKRAILEMVKGPPGTHAFEAAFRAWARWHFSRDAQPKMSAFGS